MQTTPYRILDQHRVGSSWAGDEIGKRYHFPKKYLKLLDAPGIRFIYHEPKTKGKWEFYGCGEIGKVSPDPENNGEYFAEIVGYRPFLKPVSASGDNGERREDGPFFNQQNAVRRVELELFQRLCKEGGITDFPADANNPSPAPTKTAYWWLNANPKIWDFRSAPIGSTVTYTSHNDDGNKRQKYKHFTAVRPGDLVLGYITTPDKEIVALCEIVKPLHKSSKGEAIVLRKIEQFANAVSWDKLKSIKALENCEPLQSNQGSLFTVTPKEYQTIRALIDGQDVPKLHHDTAAFTKADALAGLFMSSDELDAILARLKRKKALILQGPPGVGKTFIAKRLAFAMMGQKDENRVAMVQFHPSYGYEDFVQGYRPTGAGLERRNGIFHQFVQRAQTDTSRDWFFIIDEINRGNLAKIFGELLMLLEADKRGASHAVPLTYSHTPEETFYLPSNVHIIGTMNTADRSLAMVDYALRRRFAFETLAPAIDSDEFEAWLLDKGASQAMVEKIRGRIGSLNAKIDKERDLGERFRIGHSFFCPGPEDKPDESWYAEIISSEIKPLLDEYFDSSERVKSLVDELLK
jgi:5-methylcytosine-specific restriction protein B